MNKFYRMGLMGFICLILCICLGSACYAGAHGYGNGGFSLGAGKVELTDTHELELDGVRLIDIQYISQNIEFFETDDDKLVVKEYLNNKGANGRTIIETKDGTLSVIREEKGGIHFQFGFTTESERIEIYLPKNYKDSLQAAVVSGNLHSQSALDLKSFCVASTSGNISCEQLHADAIAVASTSGNIELEKVVGALSAAAVSGNIDIEYEEVQYDIGLSTTSGNIRLSMPKESSFTYDGSATSGSIKTDFDESLSFNDKKNKAQGSYNGGTDLQIQTETTSGNTKIALY